MAASLAAVKLGIPVAHVEAGLRSFDRTMPEEINRIVTDAVADMLFVSEPAGMENLRREGHPEGQLHLVGNVMIDNLLRLLPQAKQPGAARPFRTRSGALRRGDHTSALERGPSRNAGGIATRAGGNSGAVAA